MRRCLSLGAALSLIVFAAAAEPTGLTAAQLDGLRQGRGLGLSMPAELNGHPGPLHVLENAEALMLTPDQTTAVAALTARMKAEAVGLGERVIAKEGELDALFAAGRPDDARLSALVEEIGRLNAALRLVHLRTHVSATALLTPEQVAAYYRIRHHRHG